MSSNANNKRIIKTPSRHQAQWLHKLCLVIALLTAGMTEAQGQTDYSGTYYIGSVGYNAANTTTNYYLCPTEGWCYYQATNDFTGTDNGMPFLTTYQCRNGSYDDAKAVWTIEKAPAPNDAYYYIKQALTGRYLTSNGTIRTTNNADRLRVHLESVASENLDYKQLFTIDFSDNKYFISPKDVTGGASDRIWLVVNGGNKNSLVGQAGKANGPTGYTNTAGIIGLYTKDDTNAPFYLEITNGLTPPPVITNNFDGTITITGTGTIYYTTDNTKPTTSSATYSTPIVLTDAITVVKAMAKDGANHASEVVTYRLPKCEKPVITVSGGMVTITTTTTGASIYYTDNDTSPTSSSTLYSSPFPLGDISAIRAIAVKTGWVKSNEAFHYEFTTVSSSSEITRMDGVYRLASNFASTAAIGSASDPFTGIIDGQMNTISDLDHPLVAYAENAVIRNVILNDVNISSGTNVGAICGEAKGATRIYNCGVLATGSTVEKDDNGYDVITSCSSSVSGSGYVGGIVGLLDGSSRVINCFSYANVSGGSRVGGIVGYNNVATTAANLKTMVMNCMFYGEVSGSSIAPIYNGKIITNVDNNKGVSNFNYFRLESTYIQNTAITKVYNCALGAETRFLQRFEFFRYLLNSNRELAAWWATDDADNKDEMMKWVMEPSQIGTSTPYPILKTPDKYASVVNYTPNVTTYDEDHRNEGRKLGTLAVTIQAGSGAPTDASITTSSLNLTITDKDFEHFNYNYGKVQLPYYNDYCDGNYTGGKVVTGWKIVSITGGTAGSYFTGSDVTYTNGELTATPYNFADRKCTNKDLYSVSGRVFNQGAYWDVPEGVTAITIQPYWGKAVYLADAYYDVVYNTAMTTAYDVTAVGGGQRYINGESTFNGQLVYTSMSNAISSSALFSGENYSNKTVYDYAVVLVGNYHHTTDIEANKPYTVTSVDLDGDNEPDYSLMLRFNSRIAFHPVRYDFLNLIGLGMAQKSTGGTGSYNLGIMQPTNWFEVTNTALFRVTQFEYERSNRAAMPLILQGGVIEQWVSYQSNGTSNKTTYIHVGGNVWFKEFHMGVHQDKNDASSATMHPPVSVTGGNFDEFYLTGLYQSQAAIYDDNAECYINGGRFGEMAGAGMERIGTSDGKGNVTWIIDNADIKEFYGGGINAAKPVHGNIHTIISNSHVDVFCGGPKFGDMEDGRTVTTTATNCTFGTYFGAGYGGNSYNRYAPTNQNNVTNINWNNWVASEYTQSYSSTYGGVSTQIDYQFIPMSNNTSNVARLWVEYVNFSLATCHDVTSSLTGCKITNNFYGGGSLGKVDGDVTSTLTNCTVEGSVFGAGYSASLPTVEVMNTGGFQTEPYYYTDLGTYRTAVFPATTTYTWQQGNAIDIDKTNHILYTTEDLNTLGTVSGDVTLNITGNTLVEGKVFDGAGNVTEQTGGVFGGGDESKVTGTDKTVTVNINQTGGSATRYVNNVFGGGNKGDVASEVQVTIQGTSYVSNNVFGGGNLADVGGSVTVDMISGTVMKDVYGGGALANTNISNVTAGYGTVSETIPNTTSNTTTVTLTGGTIMGDAYGGGLGRIGVATVTGVHFTQEEINAAVAGDPAYGKTTDDWKVEPVTGVEAVKALVYGDVTVTQNGTAFVPTTTTDNEGNTVVTAGRIFGCNNLNGSPMGTVLVQVNKTVRADGNPHAKSVYDANGNLTTNNYEMNAVYGGGNLAAYNPATATLTATGQFTQYTNASNQTVTRTLTNNPLQVVINGCSDVSIEYVYGGGNAAPTPSTDVLILGAFEIGYTFGGGNGKDKYTIDGGAHWNTNPGADVGIIDATAYAADHSNGTYGSGDANTAIYGGTIHEVYGASNQKGNIAGDINLDVKEGETSCTLKVGKIVGAGKNADIDGDVILVMGCMPTTKTPLVFGGADNANVNGNVELTITSGTFGKVFGGNNLGGIIKGHLKINIEETGCNPIKIDELYLGGNEAAYSRFGYYDTGITDSYGRPIYSPRESADDSHPAVTGIHNAPYAEPVLNVISCTYIGKVFGGGLGTGAAMYANPTVNINMIKGEYYNNTANIPVDDNNPNKLGLVGDVYGGGNEAAVYGNTTVNIGTAEKVYFTSEPTYLGTKGTDYTEIVADGPNKGKFEATAEGAYITGTVYGAGKGNADYPERAIVTGNTRVNMAGGHVSRSIYGGGELGSVGTFTEHWTADTWDATKQAPHFNGEPKTCQAGTGLTEVIISGGQVGLVNQLMPDPSRPTSDDDYGYVFCACKGVADSITYAKANLLAVCGSTHLEVSGGLVAASVYGGSENGEVLGDTYVEIKGGQIGSGHYQEDDTHHWDDPYTDAQWTAAINAIKSGVTADIHAAAAPFHECDAWPFGTEGNRHVYDYYANDYDSQGGAKPGSDGHSYYGHVFGGGSGYYPFAAGKWRRTAGRVNGNTLIEISGGHILTNVYGGNEITDVLGSSKVEMWGGTVGIPRTLAGIQACPVNSYIFGAGMGDPRVLFNGWSNVASADVIVRGDAVVFGSVFGGGEDGHVLGDVSTTIKGDALIGTFGSSGIDGNIFGSGRGFSTLTLTAGAVCGNVTVNIEENARILGSVFGGGRMAAVGTYLAEEGTANYGVLIPDGKNQVLGGTDVDASGATHGYVTINITGGTIGNPSQLSTSQYSIGDVFGGSKGIFINGEWTKSQKLGLVKNTEVNISQAEGSTTTIYGNVYGGGEIASVGSYNYATQAQATTYNQTHTSENMYEGDVYEMLEDGTGLAKILITGGTIGQNSLADTKGNVFGGCLGKAGATYSGYSFVNNSDVTLQGGTVYGSIFGGGENGHVFSDTDVKIKSGSVGIALHDKVIANLSDAEKNNMIYRGNVYGGGRGIDQTTGGDYSITAGKVAGNTNVTVEGGQIFRNVYGGGSLASVGVREEAKNQSLVTETHPFPYNTGLATVTIKGGQIGTDGGASANNYNTLIPDRESRKENGFVFGSGRGMAAGAVGNSTLVQLAYTKNTLVSIEGTGNVTGSVFGGGENGHVSDNTKVYVKENCFVGTELIDAEHVIDDNGRGRLLYRGNVYGGGRGIDTGGDGNYSLTAGRVYGDTYVEVSGGKIYHDVFGGGSLASVGNETVNPTTGEITYGDESGEAEVHIKGGIIGYSSNAAKQGFNCGFVYGGCRGLSADPSSDIVKMAYVHDAKVYIEPGANIKGSVFGGGANGHVKNDTYVEISGGSVGTALTAAEAVLNDHGVAPHSIFRGNVYAGGRGVDMFQVQQQGTTAERYSLSAGAVYGNAELKMTGGHVWHNIYGSGAMASVGTVEAKPANTHVHDEIVDASNVIQNPDTELNYLTGVFKANTGKVTILITGGTVGDTTPGHEGINNGNVFGAGRGVSASRSDYVASMEFVDNTDVTIGTSGQTSYTGSAPGELNYPYIYGSVYGGGENGHVKTDTRVKIYSGLIGWPLVEGEGQKFKEATDGSAKNPYHGHVFGGGCGVDPLYHGSSEERSSTAGRVYGHTFVTMTGGVVRRAIYGGGLLASVGIYRLLNTDMHIIDMIEDPGHDDGGDATINISGGYVGNVNHNGTALSGTGVLAPGDNNGFVFGSSCGMVADNYEDPTSHQQVDVQYRQMGYSHSTHVSISGDDTHIFGCVFGSGENGHVWEDAIINISGGTIGSEGNTSKYVGNVYGSGRGVDHPHEHISESAGKVRGNTTVNITGGIVWRDVYGGGSLASVGEANEAADNAHKKGTVADPLTYNPFPYATGLTRVVLDNTATVHGSVYGSGRGVASTLAEYKQAAYVKNTLVTVKGNARVFGHVFGGGNAGHVRKNTDVTIEGSAKIDNCVYGGGAGDISSPTAGLVNHDVVVNIKGGLIGKDVYGGGAIANTNVHDVRNTAITDCGDSNRGNAKTEVNLLGGIILGDAYGGGQGVIPASTATAAEKANAGALVQGDVTVTLNGTAIRQTSTNDDQNPANAVPASGRVFGCNNLNGTPQGTVLVKVLQTKGVTESEGTYTINNTKPQKETDTYEVQAVYGGGNLAAYDPWNASATGQYTETNIISATERPLQVLINGCDLTSIEYVYGGGNAASVPSTQVIVKGAYEIGHVFGGGNGKDRIYKNGAWAANPGANVGYYTYPNANNDPYDTKENRIQYYSDYRNNESHYGSGKTWATVFGGTVHSIYGGSNTKGNVRVESVAELDGESDQSCPFDVGEAYGGGRSADQDGEARLIMNCIVGLGTAYGGAENADVLGGIELNIINGTYDQVFGGNNRGGRVAGAITVNIEETGCNPIIIGELYGGGNLAPYSVYGYKDSGELDEDGKTKWLPYHKGETGALSEANKYASPVVNVKSFTSIGNVFGGGYGQPATMVADPTININTVYGRWYDSDNSVYAGVTKTIGNNQVTIPAHEKGKLGAIQNVFGGGNEATVVGNTNVNIGTVSTILFATDNPVTTSVDERTVPQPIIGANILGNVYGGGNHAEVTGNTNVVIGQ